MTSKKQVQANRRNARKSTGPKTKKGKAVARLNALQHGFTAKQVVIPGEDEQAFGELQERLVAELDPKGILESQLVERIAVTFWRLARAHRIEAGIFAWQRHHIKNERALEEAEGFRATTVGPTRFTVRLIDNHGDQGLVQDQLADVNDDECTDVSASAEERAFTEEQELSALGLAFVRDATKSNALSKLSRHETTQERALYRAIHELQRLQAARNGGAAPPLAIDLMIDPG